MALHLCACQELAPSVERFPNNKGNAHWYSGARVEFPPFPSHMVMNIHRRVALRPVFLFLYSSLGPCGVHQVKSVSISVHLSL